MVERASAQAGQLVLVVDQQRIIQSSKAGKSISDQAKKMRDDMAGEVKKEISKLQKAQENFTKNQEVMSPEQKSDKLKEIRQLQINARGLQVQRARELQQSLAKATQEVAEVLRPILEQIVSERNATHLLDRDQVMFVSEDYNITDEVLKRLDGKLSRVKVERVALKK
ncbi:MAG: OmpH family outer membrane protein [Pseudomonadota bacterium]